MCLRSKITMEDFDSAGEQRKYRFPSTPNPRIEEESLQTVPESLADIGAYAGQHRGDEIVRMLCAGEPQDFHNGSDRVLFFVSFNRRQSDEKDERGVNKQATG